MLAILDYEAGNQTSVRRALDFLGIPATVSAAPKAIDAADGLIFPGVGAAGQAMNQLRRTGLDSFLKDWAASARPLLGICLGCQILLEHSEENDIETLGVIKGRTRLFNPALTEEDGNPISVPHMGWNGVSLKRPCRLFAGQPEGSEFYFVHSYYVEPAPEFVIGTTYYGMEFCSVFGRDGLWAAQFHVEKSGQAGLALLRNFYGYCLERRNA
jgi:glutamine amidotransferase